MMNNKKFYAILLATLLSVVLSQQILASQSFRDRISKTRNIGTEEIKDDTIIEVKIGQKIAAKILTKYPLLDNSDLNKYLTVIGRVIAANSPRPELLYRVAALDSNEVISYSTPGGYIFISKGALSLMKNEAELAAMLAHEISHISHHHVMQKLNLQSSEAGTEATIMQLISGGAKDVSELTISNSVDQAENLILNLGINHRHEFEADQSTMWITTIAGYDSSSYINFLERVNRTSNINKSDMLRTHPPLAKRIQTLRSFYDRNLSTIKGELIEERFNFYTSKSIKN